SRRRHTRFSRDWSSDVCSSDLSKLVGHRDSLSLTSLLPPRNYSMTKVPTGLGRARMGVFRTQRLLNRRDHVPSLGLEPRRPEAGGLESPVSTNSTKRASPGQVPGLP